MRADRLVAIVLLLQARGQMTAGELAELLETSERTVRRDLDALGMAGVPIYSQRGRYGGWSLVDGHRLDLTGFTVEEARALFMVAGAQSASDRNTEPGLRSALRKVFMALPEPLRAQATAASETTVIDSSRWGRTPADKPRWLDELRQAVLARVQVELEYAKPGESLTRRRIHPYGLIAKGGVWYLLAGTESGRRTFRVSRIVSMMQTAETATVPENFDLADEWASAQRDFLARIQVVTVDVEISDRSVLSVTAALSGWCGVEEHQEKSRPGWRRFTMTVPHLRVAAAQFAPYGADVRVIAPSELRAELSLIGQELVSSYR